MTREEGKHRIIAACGCGTPGGCEGPGGCRRFVEALRGGDPPSAAEESPAAERMRGTLGGLVGFEDGDRERRGE